MAGNRDHPMRGYLGALVLWFAALGGAFAWFVQLIAAWSIDEVACAAGHEQISGLQLTTVLIIAVGVPCAVVLAALILALWSRRRLNRAKAAGTASETASLALNRARTVAFIAVVLDALFLVIVILNGVNLAVFAPCVA